MSEPAHRVECMDQSIREFVPAFPGEESLTGWDDLTEPGLIDIRILRKDGLVATLVRRPTFWDVVFTRNEAVKVAVLYPDEVADALLRALEEQTA